MSESEGRDVCWGGSVSEVSEEDWKEEESEKEECEEKEEENE